MTQNRSNSLVILNFHKHETIKIYLVSVGKDFIAKHHGRYSTFGKVSERTLFKCSLCSFLYLFLIFIYFNSYFWKKTTLGCSLLRLGST